MNPSEKDSLSALECLLEEFFSPSTTNIRKHEIEIQLNSLKNSPRLWTLCLYFLKSSTNQYVTMFALSTIESVINPQWNTTLWDHKINLRNHIQYYLLENGNSAPHYIRTKYAKVLVSIAKQDFPNEYPDFLNFILELLKSESNQLVGLILLRTTSEEFLGINASFEKGRKSELARLLHQYIPIVFELLNNILQNLGTKPRHTSTATPPPSPTHPTSTPTLSQQLATATFKPDSKILNREALDTVQQLFTWAPINLIPPSIIKAIFNFTNISSYAQDDDDMCVLAMSTINELLYRKCTPPGSQEFFNQLYLYTVDLLRDIVNSPSCRIDILDLIFMEKLSELLVLLIEQHLWRLEQETRFSALEFLSLLYQLTVQLPSVQCYLMCLTVWATFFKQINIDKRHKYSEAFLGLLNALLKKIQFAHNCDQLKEINCTDLNDDNETEWQIFLKSSIEVIAMIAEHAPLETLNHILTPWQNAYDIFHQIKTIINHENGLINCNNIESERLSYIITDFSTLTQTLARLSPIFFDHTNEEITKISVPIINNIAEKLLECASLSTALQFYRLKSTNSRLTESFINIHSQLLAALRTYLIWITRNDKISVTNLKLLIDLSLPVINDQIPKKLSNSSSHLLLAISNYVYVPFIIKLPSVMEFITEAPALNCDEQTNLVVYSAITNLLFKPWRENYISDENERDYLIKLFFERLTWGFNDLTPNTNCNIVQDIIRKPLNILSHIVDFSKDFPILSKKRLYNAIKPIIEKSVILFPSYAKYKDVSSCILVFFLNVLRVLQQQIGIEGTKGAVNIFLDVAIKDKEANYFLDKLLKIFQLVIESPGSIYKQFLPGILQLCMEQIYPFIIQQGNDHPDNFMALLNLLHSMLLHRWQYFCTSQVRLGNSPGFNEQDNGEQPSEPVQLLTILHVFGEGLLQHDINIFKLSLASLEDLNSKWKLYQNVLYRFNGLSKYISVLLHVLVQKMQNLLADDIHIALYNMASVSFQDFFSTFLPEYIQSIEDVTDAQRQMLLYNFVQYHDKDMPTFVQHLQIFINDAQQFKLRNTPSNFL